MAVAGQNKVIYITNKNEWYWIINAIMTVLMAISIIVLKNKYITYIILTVLTCTLVLEYIIKINKIKRNKDLQKNKIDLLNGGYPLCQMAGRVFFYCSAKMRTLIKKEKSGCK